MQNFKFKPLPLSCSDISLLRQSGMIYVDKSDLICRLCSRINAQIFLSRPRRFGKSLLVSTFESLFKYGLRDFQGLHIEKLWQDTNTYRVVRLDFTEAREFSDLSGFKTLLLSLLDRRFSLACRSRL